MRRLVFAMCVVVCALGCQPVPAAEAAAQAPSRERGTIPITTRSDEVRAIFLRGRTLNENLQAHEAHAVFQQAVALDPSFAFGEYSLATTSPTARERDEHLQKALTLSEKASIGERLLILGFEARTHGDPDRARQIADSLVAQYPDDERAHWTLANACSAQQNYDRAIAEFNAAITLNPRYSLAYNQLGYAYRSAGQMAAAESAFRQYIALVPNDPNPYDSYAELLMKSGRFDESIVQYRKAQSIDRHFAGAFVGIAADEMYAGRPEAAIIEAERYLSVARDDGERRTALVTLAMIHVEHGATVKALRAMERRSAMASAIGDTVNMSADGVIVGEILLEAGRPEAARERFDRAHALLAASSADVELKRDDALAAHYDAARVALAKSNLPTARAEAIAYATGASARHNDARVRQAHELTGLVALASRMFGQSVAEFALADQQNPAVLAAMARVYAGRGEMAKALELQAQARNMNILPTFPYVFTRAFLAAATPSATSGSAGERPR